MRIQREGAGSVMVGANHDHGFKSKESYRISGKPWITLIMIMIMITVSCDCNCQPMMMNNFEPVHNPHIASSRHVDTRLVIDFRGSSQSSWPYHWQTALPDEAGYLGLVFDIRSEAQKSWHWIANRGATLEVGRLSQAGSADFAVPSSLWERDSRPHFSEGGHP